MAEWPRTRRGARNLRTRTALTRMVLVLPARSETTMAELRTTAGLSPRDTARTTLRPAGQNIAGWFYRPRLTRAAEDALPPVVTGK